MPNVEPLREGDPAAVGPYRLVGRLGAGGHGVVYLGQARNGTPVAVKVLREGLAAGERLAQDIAAARKVEPFCLARVLDASTGGRPYIVAEYVDGPPLQRAGRLGGAELQRLAVATATALDSIHQAGVVHGDFKPANVLLGPDGPQVVDFGIAGAFGSGMSATSNIVGTPAYMAPEQLSGKAAGAPADVFAWASVIVFAATGVPPFGDDSLPAVIHRMLHEEPQIGDLRRPLREIVPSCLAKDPAARPAMRDVLLRLIGGDSGPGGAGRGEVPDAHQPAAQAWHEMSEQTLDHDVAPGRALDQAAPVHGQPLPTRKSRMPRDRPGQAAPAARPPAPHPARTPTGHAPLAAPAPTGHTPFPAPQPVEHTPLAAPAPAEHAPFPAATPAAHAPFPGSGERLARQEEILPPSPVAMDPPTVEQPAARSELAEHSALVELLVPDTTAAEERLPPPPPPPPARPRRRRLKTVLVAAVSGVCALALGAAIVWLTPTTPTPKTSNMSVTTDAPAATSTAATPRPKRTRTARPTPQTEGSPGETQVSATEAAGGGRLTVVYVRAGGTRNGDCWTEPTLQALVRRTGAPLSFDYTWVVDGVAAGRFSTTISENGQRYLTSPRGVSTSGVHRVTLRITSPVTAQRTVSVTTCGSTAY
ncbi:serine/threonine-protein kinase [Nonomuraea sp. NPDC002799]